MFTQTQLDIAALVVSLLALSVSVWAVWSSSRVARAQLAQQERITAIEEAREAAADRELKTATLSASVLRDGRDRRLQIRNDGHSTAKDIRLLLDGGPLEAHPLAVQGDTDLPVRLAPGSDSTVLLGVTMGSPSLIEVTLSWSDATGENREWISNLKVF